ncbi:Maf family protein [Anaerosphaera multitolerans]|uniref:dTTP/UTP pyrophosphatase n=1 Tax=Anaerosphaera multitolerans TaxID=2487351 RepID=A0A437S7S4_9FIRM|nr:Maf family protein [Anaerosphaera multitolerans]RVU54968.1 septum formation protein Maf [Anaerosphaera multitolerans]
MIILASNSPRRQEILSRFTDISIVSSDIDENNDYYDNPIQLVMALSFEKGIAVALENPSNIVISADTVIDFNGEILGKPQNREDAKNMLQRLSGKKHKVITGYSIFKLEKNIKYTDYVVSYVFFKDLTEEEVEDYLNTEEFWGKSGSYAIQGYGSLLIDSMQGSFENIVGLPISKIADDLKKLFGISLLKEVLKNEKSGDEL